MLLPPGHRDEYRAELEAFAKPKGDGCGYR